MSAPEPRLEDLTPFARGYVEAMLRDRFLRDKISGAIATLRTPDLDVKPYSFSDLAPETRAQIIADCERYLGQTTLTTHTATADDGRRFYSERQAAPAYMNAAPKSQTIEGEEIDAPYWFPPLTLQLCDDGKVRYAKAGGGAE